MSCSDLLVPVTVALVLVFGAALLFYAITAVRRTRRMLERPRRLHRLWLLVLFGSSMPPQVGAEGGATNFADPDLAVVLRESRIFQRNAALMGAAFAGLTFLFYGAC